MPLRKVWKDMHAVIIYYTPTLKSCIPILMTCVPEIACIIISTPCRIHCMAFLATTSNSRKILDLGNRCALIKVLNMLSGDRVDTKIQNFALINENYVLLNIKLTDPVQLPLQCDKI